MELDAPNWLLGVRNTSKWRVLGGGDSAETFGELAEAIAVRHVLYGDLANNNGDDVLETMAYHIDSVTKALEEFINRGVVSLRRYHSVAILSLVKGVSVDF